MTNLKSDSGTYALILKCDSTARVQVGKLGEIDLKPGYYIYIGSAFGPGGVRGRVSRHLREDKPKHWHIDYLSEHITPLEAWVSYEPERLEHKWAKALFDTPEMTPIGGFGCSDCVCYSHLFHKTTMPAFNPFSSTVDGNSIVKVTTPFLMLLIKK